MFGLTREASNKATKEDWPAKLDAMAREAEPAALAKADELLAAYVAEYERQTAGYSFCCERFGDFLQVMIERQGNQPSWPDDIPKRKVAATLNIGATRRVELLEGGPPDCAGVLGYAYTMRCNSGAGQIVGGTGFGLEEPPEGYRYEIMPRFDYAPHSRDMLVEDADRERGCGGSMMYNRSHNIQHTTPNFPRAARDDKIVFHGIKTTLYAPHGKGQEVLGAIHAAMATGPQPTSPPPAEP